METEKRPFNDFSYEKFLSEEKLMGSKCRDCQSLYVPPRAICPKCFGSNMEWVRMKGQGELAAFTCIFIGPPFMAAQGFNRKNPYCTGVVRLEEGAKVDARIVGVDALHPETINVSRPMKVKFLHLDEGDQRQTYLAFEPA